MARHNLSWAGKPLYAPKATTRDDKQYPHCVKFRSFEAGIADGAFLAHYDAAGGERPYGVHNGTRLGTKLDAVVACVGALPGKGTEGGSKVVIFSAWQSALSLLYVELLRLHDRDAVASVGGSDSNAELNLEIERFRSDPRCFILLLSVSKCATGLTLTCADHCFLVELQQHEGMELQLVNRIWRIGQTRPVVVKKFLMMGTVEGRIYRRRRRAGGLYVDQADETDRIAVVEDDEDSVNKDQTKQVGSAAEIRQFNLIRNLLGLSE